MSDVIRFTNGLIAMPNGSAVPGDLFVSQTSGLIVSGQAHFYDERTRPVQTVNLQGNLLAPGLIDVQINGAYGVDFSELAVEDQDGGRARYLEGLDKVARRLPESGCTSFLPTVITQEEALYGKLLGLLKPRAGQGATALGYHAEGPFLHPLRRGAHSQALLAEATDSPPIRSFEKMYGRDSLAQDGVKLITLAPEVAGVMECIPQLSARGCIVSLGHSDASLDVAAEATKAGAKMLTHLFNAMPPIHHRDPGIVGLLGQPSDRPYYGIICDGIHCHPNTVRIAYGASRESCILVTDAQSPMDPTLPDGVHDWRGDIKFRKEGYKVLIEGTNTLAGSQVTQIAELTSSCCPLNELVANLSRFTGCALPEALLTATLHPARLLGLNKGELREGLDADLVVLTLEGKVLSTWVAGKKVFQHSNA